MLISFGERGADIKVRYEKIACNNMPRCHSHEEYELYFLTEGERYLFARDRFYHVRAGDAFLISPDVEHRTLDVKSGGYARLVINLPPAHIPLGSAPGSDIMILRPKGELAELLRAELDALISCTERDEAGLAAYSSVMRALSLVLDCESIADGLTVASPSLDRVGDILKYIDAHYTEPISLTSLSEKFYLSEFYLCRLFKEYTGRTVLGYLTSLRVNQAKRLLLFSKLSVGKIAKAVGFGSVSAFGSAFRARVGCSPREWRKAEG